MALSADDLPSTTLSPCRQDNVRTGLSCDHCFGRRWDSPLVAMRRNSPSEGTNNVFPRFLESTVAGMAAGALATEKVKKESVCLRNKRLLVEINEQSQIDWWTFGHQGRLDRHPCFWRPPDEPGKNSTQTSRTPQSAFFQASLLLPQTGPWKKDCRS